MNKNIALKYAAAALAAALFVGLTVWLVRSEGQRTRESIHEAAHEAGKEAGGEVGKGIVDKVAGENGSTAKKAVDEARKASHEVLGDVKDILRPAENGESDKPASAQPEKPSASPSATIKNEKPGAAAGDAHDAADSSPFAPPEEETSTPADSSAKSDSHKNSLRSADPIQQIFDLGHEVTKAADDVGQDLLALSWDEEKKVGADVHRKLARDLVIVRPPEIIQRLERLARPIANQRTRKELVFTLEVIKSDEVNAFSHAGGYVYVTSGLLDLAKSDAELQFFLVHEIAHQELKHVAKRMTYAARASQLGGQAAATLAQTAYMTIALGYSKDQEFAADAWAFRAMLHAGRSRDEALAGMRRVLEYVNKKQMEPKPSEARTAAQKTVRQIENHFKSHPPTAERLKRLEAIRD